VSPGDGVRVTTRIEVDPAKAFDVFTREIGSWWRRDLRYRFGAAPLGRLRFEPGVGGRLLEVEDEGSGAGFEVGRVLVWEPGARLAFEFRARDFAPGERTEVDVRFEAEGTGTRLTLEHRGWDGLRPGHPARRGYTGQAFADMIGLWWADLLVALRGFTARA
jgi:hypothetical protein